MNCSYIVGLLVLLDVFYIVLSKNTRELSISNEDEKSEPSCDELRKMWRHTKREMQQKTEMVPRYKTTRYHEPFAYGWKTPARPRNAMKYAKPVYGRIVHSPDKFLYRNNIPDRFRSYDQVARMVGSSSYYTPTLTSPAKPTFFRLEYPVRRPVLPVRISHIGRFQELQNVLRNERAGELQMMKLKDNESSESTNNESDGNNSRYEGAFPFQQPRVEEDDATDDDSKERKLRGTSRDVLDEQNTFLENKEPSLSIDLSEDSGSISSTSKPNMGNKRKSKMEKLLSRCFICDVCKESFTRKDNLIRHMKMKNHRHCAIMLPTDIEILLDENIPRRWALGEWKR